MTEQKKLEALRGTDYKVRVAKEEGRYYTVEITKPVYVDGIYDDDDLIAARTLGIEATEEELNELILTLIPGLAEGIEGEYIGEEEITDGD